MDERKVSEIKSHFSKVSGDYDARIRKIIPRYDEMLNVLVSCIDEVRGRKSRAIDLGCGTGALSARYLDSHPHAELTCLDMTEEMLDLAKERMGGRRNVRYVLSDFHEFRFDGPYDHVISSLALHHAITDRDKLIIYQRIFDALAPGGSFFNADLVLGSDDRLQGLNMERWKEFMYQGLPSAEVDGEVLERYRREDSPAKLTDHLRWLNESGFVNIDVVWKHYNFAVYGGRKG